MNYARQHADDDVRLLALRGSKDPAINLPEALQQIQGRQTARYKLPTWAANDTIVYPAHLNMEQCSSETTARYKAALCRRILGHRSSANSLTDLTGGFGVDFSFMSEAFDSATYVEKNPQLFAISSKNLRQLVHSHPTFVNTDATDVLSATCHTTLFFLDPARRDDQGQRTYAISDCTPNVLEMKNDLLAKADYVLLKLSPMLDWQKTANDLGSEVVREIHIVATANECKELLLLLSLQGEGQRLYCVNDKDTFIIDNPLDKREPTPCIEQDDVLSATTSHYLYEPNAAIMKAGCFDELALRYPIRALAPNSHLFVSPDFIEHFPGRSFRIKTVSTMNKRDLKAALSGTQQANISVRNFPLSVAQLRQRLRLDDGGNTYIFATTLVNGMHALFVCEKTSFYSK